MDGVKLPIEVKFYQDPFSGQFRCNGCGFFIPRLRDEMHGFWKPDLSYEHLAGCQVWEELKWQDIAQQFTKQ